MAKHSDLKFFTNNDEDSLLRRFSQTLKDAKHFDVLVGYFRTSGFYRLYKDLEKAESIRILIGLNADRKTFEFYEEAKNQPKFDFESHKNCREIYCGQLIEEMETTQDSAEVETAAQKFIEFIKSGELKLRMHPSQNIHAKVYITRFKEDDRDFGRVVTGSSNFSESGFVARREFNVELKDRVDVEYALDQFEELWKEGVDLNEQYVDTIQKKTWLNDQITPYEIYLKFLYEYFKEDINIDKLSDLEYPGDFMDLEYQKQAVVSAQKILDAYGGVFLSDVVGLGKTYITALLLQRAPRRHKLIICPPVLKKYWEETLTNFFVDGFHIESLGKLEQILEDGVGKYTYVVVDEAHRFRNELTQNYEKLHGICRNKKVILISATPLNNKLEDIKNQIKLFQPTKNSTIPGVQNLDNFFRKQQNKLDKYEKGTQQYTEAVKDAAEIVRDKVLKNIMVRRTRSEIKKYFSDDIDGENLHFPDMADPERIVYKFNDRTEHAFNETMSLLPRLSYARYTPLLFLKNKVSEFEQQSQRNVGGFMKVILVKRLESSFCAFKKTLGRFILSYEKFLKMYDGGTVWISKQVDVFDLLDEDNEEKLLEYVEAGKAEKYASEDFVPEYREKLVQDMEILEQINGLWANVNDDPKIEKFIEELKQNSVLSNQKVLVFSESKETVEYLQENLDKHFAGQVLSYSSHGGIHNGNRHNRERLREIIQANYQPNHDNPKDDVSILLTTDILAEGVNLHRSNIIINYDLPWNPTRVLQRVGRVNRVGTTHSQVYVFNIFPTTQSDAHLGLEDNIKTKIQAFHSMLGEDAKYLSDDEELSTHELFGDKLYQKLNDRQTFEDDQDQEEDSELRYLKVIRDIRDNDSDLFARIKELPKKARAARKLDEKIAYPDDQLLTFFRKGMLKKFILTGTGKPEELTFMEAARLFECVPNISGEKIPKKYFEFLKKNKDYLEEITIDESINMNANRGGSSNETRIIKIIKAFVGKNDDYTDEEEEYLKMVRAALEKGSIPRNTSKRIRQEIEKKLNPLNVLYVLRNNINEYDLREDNHKPREQAVREIILSEFLTGKNK